MKSIRMTTIFSRSLSKYLGRKVIPSRIVTIAVLTGIAREIWVLLSKVITFASWPFEQTAIRAFFTSSEMKEFVSRVFFISLEKISSRSQSSCFFNWVYISLMIITPFLLRVDLRLSVSFMISGTMALVMLGPSCSGWLINILLNLLIASLLTCQSSDFSSVMILFNSFWGSWKGLKPSPFVE